MMYKILLAAGAASLAFAVPAMADPGKKKGHGNQAKHGQTMSKAHGKQARHARKIHQGHIAANHWGNRNCPPGLAKKNNGCLPPGIAKQSFNVGDRWNGNYGLWNYNQGRSTGATSTDSTATTAIIIATATSTASIRAPASSSRSSRR